MDQEFSKLLKKNKTISRLEKKIRDGKGTFADAGNLASLSGTIMANLIEERLDAEFPNGSIQEDDVRRIISPLLKQCHVYTTGLAARVADKIYTDGGVHMKGVATEYDQGRENELVKMISARSFENEQS